jgi:hypothetical protein
MPKGDPYGPEELDRLNEAVVTAFLDAVASKRRRATPAQLGSIQRYLDPPPPRRAEEQVPPSLHNVKPAKWRRFLDLTYEVMLDLVTPGGMGPVR